MSIRMSAPYSVQQFLGISKRLVTFQRLLAAKRCQNILGASSCRGCNNNSQTNELKTDERGLKNEPTAGGNVNEQVRGVRSSGDTSETFAVKSSSMPALTNSPNDQPRLQTVTVCEIDKAKETVPSENVSTQMPDPSSSSDSSSHEQQTRTGPPVPPDPETCCESGCVNCVWIKYAEEVKAFYPDRDDHKEKLKEILGMIEDYNVKMFIKMELGVK